MVSRFMRGTGLAPALAATGAFAADYGSSATSGTGTAQDTKPGMTQGNSSAGSPSSTRAAGSDATKSPMSFDRLDKNHDSYVDRSEAAAMPGLTAVFDKYDKAKKGKLDRAEFDQATRDLSQAK